MYVHAKASDTACATDGATQASVAHTAEKLAHYEEERCGTEAELQALREACDRTSAALVVAEDARTTLLLEVFQW